MLIRDGDSLELGDVEFLVTCEREAPLEQKSKPKARAHSCARGRQAIASLLAAVAQLVSNHCPRRRRLLNLSARSSAPEASSWPTSSSARSLPAGASGRFSAESASALEPARTLSAAIMPLVSGVSSAR